MRKQIGIDCSYGRGKNGTLFGDALLYYLYHNLNVFTRSVPYNSFVTCLFNDAFSVSDNIALGGKMIGK